MITSRILHKGKPNELLIIEKNGNIIVRTKADIKRLKNRKENIEFFAVIFLASVLGAVISYLIYTL